VAKKSVFGVDSILEFINWKLEYWENGILEYWNVGKWKLE
jgi:hypothetical protein